MNCDQMHWEISAAKGSGTDYIGHADSSSVSDAVDELWRKYINDSALLNAEIGWDHLRIELWLDSGRVILYPAVTPFHRRVEKSSCQIISRNLLNFYETLIEAGLSDDKLETTLAEKENELIMLLSASAKKMKLPELLNRSVVHIYYFGADLHTPLSKQTLPRSTGK